MEVTCSRTWFMQGCRDFGLLVGSSNSGISTLSGLIKFREKQATSRRLDCFSCFCLWFWCRTSNQRVMVRRRWSSSRIEALTGESTPTSPSITLRFWMYSSVGEFSLCWQTMLMNSFRGKPWSQSINALSLRVRGRGGIRRAKTRRRPSRVEVSTRKILHESPRVPFNLWA